MTIYISGKKFMENRHKHAKWGKVYVRIVMEILQRMDKRNKYKMPWIYGLYFMFQKANNLWGFLHKFGQFHFITNENDIPHVPCSGKVWV